ncbi:MULTISPECIES: hypothetical protein [Streptomyces]|uniref:Uncharacterized protein n=1 Tax=Streptomyces flavovirens TaxID=52258 RepID=A0ABV8NHG8_9ACTN|nr:MULTISPECIES: hypothetical protein [unclassified Streptomyces]MBK3596603.1 hypothetical protein [Streptomyces sp. MBT51]
MINTELLTYQPTELLSPVAILERFSERAGELIATLPEDGRPAQAAVTAALRQAVLEAFRTREEHLARIVEMDLEARGSGNRQTTIASRVSVRRALLALGAAVDETGEVSDRFVVVEGEGESFEVLRPAYFDQATGKLILAGQLRRVPAPASGEEPGARQPERGPR